MHTYIHIYIYIYIYINIYVYICMMITALVVICLNKYHHHTKQILINTLGMMSNHLVRDILTSRDNKDKDNQEINLDLKDFIDNLTSLFMELRSAFFLSFLFFFLNSLAR
jgi:hypothetical protein